MQDQTPDKPNHSSGAVAGAADTPTPVIDREEGHTEHVGELGTREYPVKIDQHAAHLRRRRRQSATDLGPIFTQARRDLA